MSVPREMPSSEMDVEAFNASVSDNKILTTSTAPTECTNTTGQIDSSTVTNDKLEVSNVESDDKDVGEVNINMENVKCTTTASSSTPTTTNTTTTDIVGDAANVEILAVKEDDGNDEAVVSTQIIDEKIDADSNQEYTPKSTSEIVNIDVKVVANDDDAKNLDEKQVNEPLSNVNKITDIETIVKDPVKRLSNDKDDEQEIQQLVLGKQDDSKNVSSNVDSSCEVVDNDSTIVKVGDEHEGDDKADSSLEIIDNLNDTHKSDEKMDEDDEEEARKIAAAIEDDDDEDDEVDEDDVLGEHLTLEEEEEEDDEPVAQSSANAILIDDEDDEGDDEIDEEDMDDVDDIDEDDIADEDNGDVDNDEDDDIEEIIESDDDDDDDDDDDEEEEENSEPEEIRENIKINSRKGGVDKRFGPKFKSKVKRRRNFFAHLKRRSIKWLTKKMHVMESDEMISTIPNDLTTPTVGCVSISAGGGIKNKANDYRYNNIKDDEGIELIEDKDDHHHDDEFNAESDDDDDDEEEIQKSPNKIDESDSKTNKKLNKNDSNLENSIIKNIILKQNDNKYSSSSDLTRSKSKTPPNLSSETLDLTSPPPQQNPVQPPELKTNKELKNDCNLVKKCAAIQEDNNNSNNTNNNNNNSCSDKKIKNEENVKIINLSNDDIEMIEDNQAVDLSQEKQQPVQQQHTQPIELEIVDKDNKKNEKDNEIVATNQKSLKSPNNTTSSTVDCDKNLEIKKEKTPYVEPKQQPLLKSSSSSSASSEKSGDKNSNENSSKEDSGDETKKLGGGGRSTQSGAIKRSSSPSGNNQSLDYSNPSKKHCDETNSAAASIDQQQTVCNKTNNNNGDVALLNEFMDKSQNDTPDELKKNIDQIQEEIQSLDEMIKIKEQEWNNMLHLKKMKEEIFERLTRRKRINDIKSILSIGSMDGYNQLIANSLKQNNKLSQSGEGTQQASIAAATLKDYTSNMNKFSNSGNNNALASIRPSTGQIVMQNRANIKTSDQSKDKLNSQRSQRQLLPKAPSVASSILQSAVNSQNKILNYTSINLNQQKKQSIHQQQQQHQDYLNGHQPNSAASLASQSAMGRQGAIKDVQSIIADYRQKHPEEVPRRGRRLRPSFSMNEMSGGEGGREGNSRPSSADSSHSNSNLTSTPIQTSSNATATNISFKDVLVKYAKMSPSERQRLNTGNSATLLSSLNLSNSVANKAYPEVTLHPLNSNSSTMHSSEPNTNVNSSLLHGILTKNTTRPVQQYNTFSPTLARLLTAPERITPQTSALFHQNSSNSASGGGGGGTNISSLTNPGVNLTKNHNEITITPVLNSNNSNTGGASAAGTFLKRETGTEFSGSGNRIKTESTSNLDDEADDSADRLVIDEGDGSPGDQVNMSGTGQEFHENEVPECQGCKKREAQFVCAGCGNQWYCSRECQVRAWDEHSDICTG